MNVLIPPAALFEVLVAVLTPLRHDFVAQVLRPFKNLCFPVVFHTFQEIATFAMKSPKRPQNARPDPSGGPVRGHFWLS